MNDKQIIKKLTEELEQATKPKWISVEDKLPKESGTYLCWCKNYKYIKVWVKCFDAKYKKFNDYCVTHWMLLPEPPSE